VLDGPAGVEYLREIEAIAGLGVAPGGQAEVLIGPGLEADPSFTILGVAIFSPWKLLFVGAMGVLAPLGAATFAFRRGVSSSPRRGAREGLG
jgi:hypothetical protein